MMKLLQTMQLVEMMLSSGYHSLSSKISVVE